MGEGNGRTHERREAMAAAPAQPQCSRVFECTVEWSEAAACGRKEERERVWHAVEVSGAPRGLISSACRFWQPSSSARNLRDARGSPRPAARDVNVLSTVALALCLSPESMLCYTSSTTLSARSHSTAAPAATTASTTAIATKGAPWKRSKRNPAPDPMARMPSPERGQRQLLHGGERRPARDQCGPPPLSP